MQPPKDVDKKLFREFPCPIETLFQIVGGKWRTRIIWEIGTREQPVRFNELQEALAPISKKVLAHHLRELEVKNLVVRREFPEFPPKVEYKLTEFGESLKPVFYAAVGWVEENQKLIRKIRDSRKTV